MNRDRNPTAKESAKGADWLHGILGLPEQHYLDQLDDLLPLAFTGKEPPGSDWHLATATAQTVELLRSDALAGLAFNGTYLQHDLRMWTRLVELVTEHYPECLETFSEAVKKIDFSDFNRTLTGDNWRSDVALRFSLEAGRQKQRAEADVDDGDLRSARDRRSRALILTELASVFSGNGPRL